MCTKVIVGLIAQILKNILYTIIIKTSRLSLLTHRVFTTIIDIDRGAIAWT